MRDEEVAKRTGHPLSGVLQRRVNKRIPLAVRQKRLWTPGEDKLVGTAPDDEIAVRLERSVKSVQSRRLELKRPNRKTSCYLPGARSTLPEKSARP
jgi:hypothetical protein